MTILTMIDRGMVGGSMVRRSSMNYGSMIGRCSMNYGSMMSNSFILDISNIACIVISMVLDMLGTTIRKKNRVRAFNISCPISMFSSIEVSSRVVVMDSVLIVIWMRLIMVNWSMVSWCCMNHRSCVHYRCMICGGSMHNWCKVGWSMVSWGMVSWGMVSWG